MTATMVEDARPPLALVRVMNPAMRVVLRTPLGRLVRPFALLEFEGRRSSRRLRVPVGWHQSDIGPVVVTPARWRINFRDGRDATVWFHGRRQGVRGVLEDDPTTVAEILRSIAERSGSLRTIGVRTPPDHQITAADVVAVDRAIIRFDQPSPGSD
jgi:hypothetical protein